MGGGHAKGYSIFRKPGSGRDAGVDVWRWMDVCVGVGVGGDGGDENFIHPDSTL